MGMLGRITVAHRIILGFVLAFTVSLVVSLIVRGQEHNTGNTDNLTFSVGDADLTDQAAAIAETDLVTSGVAALYYVTGYIQTTTASTGPCTSDVTIGWTYNSAAKTSEVVTNHDQNTDEGASSIPVTTIRIDASTDITYTVSLDGGVNCANAVYDIYFKAVRLD